jgi:hypothetical protein
MGFMDKIQEAKRGLVEVGAQRADDIMGQANLLLKLLRDAGYQVGELDMELGLPPTVTLNVKPGPLASDSKLNAVYEANKENDVLALILGGLIQANKLRDKVNSDALEFKGAKIVLRTTPSITLHWNEKALASAAATP